MAYEDRIQNKVQEHPMDEFAAMGDLSEMDNFGDQLAELLNALSTNVIIPTEDEDELKQWAADHANGERVYAEINGELQIAESTVDDPSGPGDIELKGVGGGLKGDFSQGEAIVFNGNGDYVSEPVKINRETVSLNSGQSKTIDTSNMATTESFVLTSSGGFDTTSGAGGDGVSLTCSVDLANVDEIEIVVADGQTGYNSGQDGGGSGFRAYDGGAGGGSTALLADGQVVAEAGGGGGGGGDGETIYNMDREGGDGGNGGGPGGSGGSGGYGEGSRGGDGGDGSYKIHDTGVATYISHQPDSTSASGIIFN